VGGDKHLGDGGVLAERVADLGVLLLDSQRVLAALRVSGFAVTDLPLPVSFQKTSFGDLILPVSNFCLHCKTKPL
jgi:hypothetical protein